MISLLLLGAILANEPAAPIELGAIEARLFYKESGRLSDDILARKEPFVFHNTIIGEGDAEEYADDLLISVTMSAGRFGAPEDKHKGSDAQVVLVAHDAKGKVLGRRVHRSVLTGANGFERKVLWLNDVTCAGDVFITATFLNTRKTAKLTMGCGE